MMKDQEILKMVAKDYQGKNWHNLSIPQRNIADALTRSGYIRAGGAPSGFVGKAAP